MKKTSIASVLLAMLFILVTGCATVGSAGHKYVMKGQILDVSDSVAYLCIGSADGAKVGDEFLVYRYEKLPFAGPKQTTPSFKRETVGSVKVTQIVDVHYATASILSGNIKVHDVAELGR